MSWQVPLIVTLVAATGLIPVGASNGGDALLTCDNPGIPQALPDGSGLAVSAVRPGEVHHWLVTVDGDAEWAYFDGYAIGGEAEVRMAERSGGPHWEPCENACRYFDMPLPVPRPADDIGGGCASSEARQWVFTIAVDELAPGSEYIQYVVQLNTCSVYFGLLFEGQPDCMS